MTSPVWTVALSVIDVLEELGVRYHVGGSFASSIQLAEEPPRTVNVKSPEDTLLRKLVWYRRGGEISDRQWGDVLGIVRTQAERLDLSYLRDWAGVLGVADLLERALQ
jgi:hypothetical protein